MNTGLDSFFFLVDIGCNSLKIYPLILSLVTKLKKMDEMYLLPNIILLRHMVEAGFLQLLREDCL